MTRNDWLPKESNRGPQEKYLRSSSLSYSGLRQTWEQLAGECYAVPLTPAFLLADDPEGWVAADDGRVYRQCPEYDNKLLLRYFS